MRGLKSGPESDVPRLPHSAHEKFAVKPHGKERYTVEVATSDRIVEEIRAIAIAIQSGVTSKVNPPESAMMSVKLVEIMKTSAERRGENIKINF